MTKTFSGVKLKQLRKEKGYTQQKLANMLFVTQQSVADWEKDKTTPSTDNMLQIASILGCRTEQLYNISKQDKRKNTDNINAMMKDITSKDDVVRVCDQILYDIDLTTCGICKPTKFVMERTLFCLVWLLHYLVKHGGSINYEYHMRVGNVMRMLKISYLDDVFRFADVCGQHRLYSAWMSLDDEQRKTAISTLYGYMVKTYVMLSGDRQRISPKCIIQGPEKTYSDIYGESQLRQYYKMQVVDQYFKYIILTRHKDIFKENDEGKEWLEMEPDIVKYTPETLISNLADRMLDDMDVKKYHQEYKTLIESCLALLAGYGDWDQHFDYYAINNRSYFETSSTLTGHMMGNSSPFAIENLMVLIKEPNINTKNQIPVQGEYGNTKLHQIFENVRSINSKDLAVKYWDLFTILPENIQQKIAQDLSFLIPSVYGQKWEDSGIGVKYAYPV